MNRGDHSTTASNQQKENRLSKLPNVDRTHTYDEWATNYFTITKIILVKCILYLRPDISDSRLHRANLTNRLSSWLHYHRN